MKIMWETVFTQVTKNQQDNAKLFWKIMKRLRLQKPKDGCLHLVHALS